MCTLALLLLATPDALHAAAPSLLPISLRLTETGERGFVDSAGRERRFRGANAIVKGYPWVPATDVWSGDLSLVDADFRRMRDMGITMLRLGTMWAGVEPTRGKYNASYLAQLKTIVEGAAAYGIYTLLDGHQDLMSERFCGEGFPNWAVMSGGRSWLGDYPAPFGWPYTHFYSSRDGGRYPTRQECAHGHAARNQFAPQVAGAWEALWTLSLIHI